MAGAVHSQWPDITSDGRFIWRQLENWKLKSELSVRARHENITFEYCDCYNYEFTWGNAGTKVRTGQMIIGIQKVSVKPNDAAKHVLEKMQSLHMDSIPVVGEDKHWLFFANRGEILARLMTSIILEK